MSNITLTKLESIIQKAVDQAVAKRFPQEAKGSANAELLNFITKKPSKKAKAKAKKATPLVEIEGHPTRKTWTDAMHQASRDAYNATEGSWDAKNHAGLLAAKAVA